MTAPKMKARIRNFQAIDDVKVEFQGFTVITGRSNLGKTALIRALSAMMYGMTGDYFIKRGQDFVGGAFTHEDKASPLKVVWRKIPAAKRKPNFQPVLEINGVTHTKIGRDHKALTAPFGIIEIETSTSRLRPQVAMQHDPMFLLGETETNVAEVFKLLGRVDIVTEAQRLAKKDLRSNEATRKVRSKDQNDAEERRAKLSHVPSLRAKLDTLTSLCEGHQKSIEGRKESIALLQDLASLNPRSLPSVPPAAVQPETAHLDTLLRELLNLTPLALPKQPPRKVEIPDQTNIKLLRSLLEAETEWEAAAKERIVCESSMEKLDEERIALEKELGVCPVCSRAFETSPHQHA